MTEKELKKMSRADLLELLLLQTKENERLQAELDEANRQLEDRRIRINKAGNIAKAALEINNVMEAAQNAAKQYLDNIMMVQEETIKKSEQKLREAEQILRNAKAEAEQIRLAAKKN